MVVYNKIIINIITCNHRRGSLEKFFEKITLYEFLAYLIPGTAFLSILSIIIIAYNPNFLEIISKINFTIIFLSLLSVSYFMGIILHEFGQILESILKALWGGFPSCQWLKESSGIFCLKEIEQYKEFAKEKFNIVIENEKSADLLFHRARTLLKDIGCNDAEIMNNHYGICRTFLTIAFIGLHFLLVCLIISCSNLKLFLFLTSLSIFLLLVRRLERFGKTYVKTVLRLCYSKFGEED